MSKEFVLIGCVLRKRSVVILYFTHPLLFNENKLRTHTLQARCGTFTLLPWPLTTLTWVEPWNVKNAPCENKYVLTFSRSTSAIIATTCPRNFLITPRKKIISEVFFSISEVKQPISGHKKRRKPCVYGLSPLCYYKDNTFSRETQILLTFRNTVQLLKCSDLQQTGMELYYLTRQNLPIQV